MYVCTYICICIWMCICVCVCAYTLKFKVHCGSACEPGASSLPSTPSSFPTRVCRGRVYLCLTTLEPFQTLQHPNIRWMLLLSMLPGIDYMPVP